MKYYILAGCVVLMGALAVMMSKQQDDVPVEKSWKINAIEPETAVRPAYFAEMKWTPEAQQEVQLRGPASVKKSSKKKH